MTEKSALKELLSKSVASLRGEACIYKNQPTACVADCAGCKSPAYKPYAEDLNYAEELIKDLRKKGFWFALIEEGASSYSVTFGNPDVEFTHTANSLSVALCLAYIEAKGAITQLSQKN